MLRPRRDRPACSRHEGCRCAARATRRGPPPAPRRPRADGRRRIGHHRSGSVSRRRRGRGHRSGHGGRAVAGDRGIGSSPGDDALSRAPGFPLGAAAHRAGTTGRPAGQLGRRPGRAAALQPRPASPGVELDARAHGRGRRPQRGGRGPRGLTVRPPAPDDGDCRARPAGRPAASAAMPAGRPRRRALRRRRPSRHTLHPGRDGQWSADRPRRLRPTAAVPGAA